MKSILKGVNFDWRSGVEFKNPVFENKKVARILCYACEVKKNSTKMFRNFS